MKEVSLVIGRKTVLSMQIGTTATDRMINNVKRIVIMTDRTKEAVIMTDRVKSLTGRETAIAFLVIATVLAVDLGTDLENTLEVDLKNDLVLHMNYAGTT